eukprot:Filipodium_phascolosomae@DN1972_c0_g1_i2.p1
MKFYVMQERIVMRNLALGWGAFIGSHMFLAHPPVRETVASWLGDMGAMRFNGLVGLCTFIPTTVFYLSCSEKCVWAMTFPRRVGGACIFVLGTLLLVDSYCQGGRLSPTSLFADKSQEYIFGALRITRHPINMSMSIYGLGCMLMHTSPVARLHYAGFPLLGLLGSYHQDYRLYKQGQICDSFWRTTGVLPFEAIMTGKQSLSVAFSELHSVAGLCAIVVLIAFAML